MALAVIGVGPGSSFHPARGQEQEPEPAEAELPASEPTATPQASSGTVSPPPSIGPDEVIGVAGATLETAVVATGSGRVFAFAANERAWMGVNAGGLSARLAQVRGFAGEVWGIGDEAPAFRFATPTWSAAPVNRKGAARLASCAVPAFVAGRRVFVRESKHWKELRRVPGKEPIAELCVAGPGQSAILLASGEVQVLQGGSWKPLAWARGTAATSEGRIAWMGGGLWPVVATESGKLYRLDGGKPVAIALDRRLARLRPSVAASGDKRLWIVGRGLSASVGGGEISIIARLDGKKLVLVEELPGAVGGRDWIGMVATNAGVELLAARDGTLVRRTEDGGWVIETLLTSPAPASGTGRPANPPARVGATPH